MARKKIWLTWLPPEGGSETEGGSGPQDTVAFLTHSGLEVGGAPWVDDPDKLAWSELGNLLLGENAPIPGWSPAPAPNSQPRQPGMACP